MLEKTMLKRHYELWDWLSKNPTMDKGDYFKWGFRGGHWKDVSRLCYLCLYSKHNCAKCPLRFCSRPSLFDSWKESSSPKRRCSLAEQIRDIIKVKN